MVLKVDQKDGSDTMKGNVEQWRKCYSVYSVLQNVQEVSVFVIQERRKESK